MNLMNLLYLILLCQVGLIVVVVVSVFIGQRVAARAICNATLTIAPGAIAKWPDKPGYKPRFQIPWKPVKINVGTDVCSPDSDDDDDASGDEEDSAQFAQLIALEFREFLDTRRAGRDAVATDATMARKTKFGHTVEYAFDA